MKHCRNLLQAIYT